MTTLTSSKTTTNPKTPTNRLLIGKSVRIKWATRHSIDWEWFYLDDIYVKPTSNDNILSTGGITDEWLTLSVRAHPNGDKIKHEVITVNTSMITSMVVSDENSD